MSTPSNEPLPWRPFYPEPLPQPPETYLFDLRDEPRIRAVMEILERRITHVVRDLSVAVLPDVLLKGAGTLDAYLDLHRHLTRAVEVKPKGGQQDE